MIEREVFTRMLDDLSDRFGNAGCNDFEIPNTPEYQEFVERVVRHNIDEEDADEWLDEIKETPSDTITIFDIWVLEYLRDLFGFPTVFED